MSPGTVQHKDHQTWTVKGGQPAAGSEGSVNIGL